MRRLMLLRHAKSEWPDGIVDLERPLAPRGRAAAPLIAAYLAREGLIPDRVIVSPARRTRETFDLVAEALPPSTVMASEPKLYEASIGRLLAVVRELPADAHTVLVIGHNDGLKDLAALLSGQGAPPALARMREKFPTGALAVIDLPLDLWSEAAACKGRLDRFVVPKDLTSA